MVMAMVVAMMVASFITRRCCRSVFVLIPGGDGHASGPTYRTADDGAIAATYRITDCCACCTAYCTTKNRIRCRTGLGCASRQGDGNHRNPLVHLHDLLLSLSKWRQSRQGRAKRTSREMLASIEKRLPANDHGIVWCVIAANFLFLMCFVFHVQMVVL